MCYQLQLGLLPLLLSPWAASAETRGKPNIVFILADDMGFNDVGFHGGDVRTPNIDALAGHGIILNRHYSEPACTPSRGALMTGKHASRLGLQGKPLAAGVAHGLPLTEQLFPQYFKKLGYKTHLVGKWHLGYQTWDHMPTRRGFDTFFGYLNGFIGYYDGVHTQVESGRDLWRNESQAWQEVYGKYLTGVLSAEAVKVIADHKDLGGLLLFVNHMAPHTGNLGYIREAPPGSLTNFSNRQIYAETVRRVDESVGQIVQALEEKGILQNTIIVFTSDNGAPTYDPIWGYSNYGSNYPFRGMKMSLHEGGVRNPAVVWSSNMKTPRITMQLFSIADWLPTLYSAAGGSSKDLKAIDGADQWAALLTGEKFPRSELLVGMDETANIEAYIKGKWKLIRNYDPGRIEKSSDMYYGESGRNTTYSVLEVHRSAVGQLLGHPIVGYDEVRRKATPMGECGDQAASLAADCHSKYCLYSVLEDPTECRDLSAEYPALVAELARRLSFHRSLLRPVGNRTYVPASNPALWADYWTPWQGGRPTGTPSSSSPSVPALSVLATSLTVLSFLC